MQQSDSLHMITDEKHMKIKQMSTSIQVNTVSLSITSPSLNQKASGATDPDVKMSSGDIHWQCIHIKESEEEC